jgi:lactoylglutathione lyase
VLGQVLLGPGNLLLGVEVDADEVRAALPGLGGDGGRVEQRRVVVAPHEVEVARRHEVPAEPPRRPPDPRVPHSRDPTDRRSIGRRVFRGLFPIVVTADLQRSLGFYRDLLGFELTYSFPSEQEAVFATLDVEGGKLGLGQSEEPVDSAPASIWLYTDDVDAAVADLRAAGVPVVAEPADQPWGERVGSVADPDGYVVHIGAPIAGRS